MTQMPLPASPSWSVVFLFPLFLVMGSAPAPAQNTLPHYPDDVQTTTVDGRTIAFVDRGSGPPLLFVHGLGSNLSLWRETMDAFEDEHRVLALDLPGYGLSGKEDVPATMSFFMDIVTGFLDERGLEEVTVVAVSMGGQVALTLALGARGGVRRLALVSPAGIEQFGSKEAAVLKDATTAGGIINSTDDQVQQNVALNFANWSDEYAWLIEQRHALSERDDFAAYAKANARSVAGMLEGDVRGRLGEIGVPTLVLFGAGDQLIPNQYLHENMTTKDVADRAEDVLPNASVRLVDNAGHLLMLERPSVFQDALQSFLGGD
jgi:pimeloyl-ACP methyl ester carboxylesterase